MIHLYPNLTTTLLIYIELTILPSKIQKDHYYIRLMYIL